ncbi:uncharacterized protein LOC121728380 [Aricia agestis]|uniref:uncharacterized protein LOC121728380 n=1 Tax=Aricia agestis TaxID=91739 RepID=UPI001C2058B9|nr:uncharacterized protein LOC121728380 [Aricia agestis]
MYADKREPQRNVISMNNAMDALEQALASQKKFILVHQSNAPRKTMLEEIMSLADIDSENLSQASHQDVRLKELNMDDQKLLAIQGFLRDVYEICLNIEDVQNLTVKAIIELESQCVDSNFEENHGIASYFPALYSDELLYTTDMFSLPTLASSATHNTIDMSKPYLCIVPGVEGYYGRFTELCKRLKLPAIALQPGLDHPKETFKELASRYINALEKKSALHNNFYLLGYERGVLIALEMVAILESKGLTGTVFCVGGTPTEVVEDFRNNLKDYKNKEHLQMAVLKHAYSLATKEDPSVLDSLPKNLDWPNKLVECMDRMRGKFQYSIEYTKKWINYLYTQLSSSLENTYEMKKMNSQIISLRPKYITSIDTSLENCSNKKIITYQLESSLPTTHLNMKCATIINSHLDRAILEIYNHRNICHTYSLSNDDVTAD